MEVEIRRSSGWGRWLSVLAGVYPFLYFGPVIVLMSYPFPPPAWRMTVEFRALLAGISLLPIAAGFAVGWLKRFPLWSYSYTCIAAGLLILGCGTLLDGSINPISDTPFAVGLLIFATLAALLVFFTRNHLPLRDLFRDIGGDWTRLSLGLLILPTFVFSSIDHDEDPTLTIFVIGPALVLFLTALLALIVKERKSRAVILAGGMLLMILVRMPSGNYYELIYWLLMIGWVFMPFLIQRQIQNRKTSQQV